MAGKDEATGSDSAQAQDEPDVLVLWHRAVTSCREFLEANRDGSKETAEDIERADAIIMAVLWTFAAGPRTPAAREGLEALCQRCTGAYQKKIMYSNAVRELEGLKKAAWEATEANPGRGPDPFIEGAVAGRLVYVFGRWVDLPRKQATCIPLQGRGDFGTLETAKFDVLNDRLDEVQNLLHNYQPIRILAEICALTGFDGAPSLDTIKKHCSRAKP